MPCQSSLDRYGTFQVLEGKSRRGQRIYAYQSSLIQWRKSGNSLKNLIFKQCMSQLNSYPRDATNPLRRQRLRRFETTKVAIIATILIQLIIYSKLISFHLRSLDLDSHFIVGICYSLSQKVH